MALDQETTDNQLTLLAAHRRTLAALLQQQALLGGANEGRNHNPLRSPMLDQEAITQQLALLATYRRTLAHLIEQAAQYGGEVFAPPQTANGIAEARQQIRRIKAVLRKLQWPLTTERQRRR
jgi:hypothetical protein